MIEFNRLLVPIDLGEGTNHITDVATDMAAKLGAKVTLLHAFIIPAAAYAEGCELPVQGMMQSAETALQKTLDRARKQYPNTDALLVRGDPWEQILAVAEERRADMIVMGTHGRRGLSHLLLGSVAERVVRTSPIPVLTVAFVGGQRRKDVALDGQAAAKIRE